MIIFLKYRKKGKDSSAFLLNHQLPDPVGGGGGGTGGLGVPPVSPPVSGLEEVVLMCTMLQAP